MRTGTLTDAPAVRTLLAQAYADDPLIRWVFPDGAFRVEATAAWLGAFVDGYLTTSDGCSVIEDDGRMAGAAMWRWPDDRLDADSPALLPTPGGILRALVGEPRARDIGAAFSVVPPLRPSEPYAYLHFLAVDAAHRRRGIARTLVSAGIDEADRRSLAVVLETTNPANHAFYRALGFEVIGSGQLGKDGPDITVMTRDPDAGLAEK